MADSNTEVPHRETKTGRMWRDRIWFYKPGSWRPGWRIVQWRGGDEYDWHTLVIGSRLTGAVVIARRPCRGTGRCAGLTIPPVKEAGRG